MGTLTHIVFISQDGEIGEALNPCNLLVAASGRGTRQSQDPHLQGKLVLEELLLRGANTEQATIFRGKNCHKTFTCAVFVLFPSENNS